MATTGFTMVVKVDDVAVAAIRRRPMSSRCSVAIRPRVVHADVMDVVAAPERAPDEHGGQTRPVQRVREDVRLVTSERAALLGMYPRPATATSTDA